MTDPTLLETTKLLYEALSDIINATGNGQPYSIAELERSFMPDLNKAYDVIYEIEGDWR